VVIFEKRKVPTKKISRFSALAEATLGKVEGEVDVEMPCEGSKIQSLARVHRRVVSRDQTSNKNLGG